MGRLKDDLTGRKFGRLMVLSQSEPIIYRSGRSKIAYRCLCECGKEKIISADHLRNGHANSCGCLASELAKKSIQNAAKNSLENKKDRRNNLIGTRFGSLTVLSIQKNKKFQYYEALCKCDCGHVWPVMLQNLKRGLTSQCSECGSKKSHEKFQEREMAEGTALCHLTQKKRIDNKTGVKGVWFDKRSEKYVAELRLAGKKYYLGTFKTLEDAKKAREAGEEKYFDPVLIRHNRAHTAEKKIGR